jgi:hypothetical protein
MRKMFFGTSLLLVFAVAGCASSQLHQSLLLHENRRLEDALYVAHAQAAHLKRENDALRTQQGTEFDDPPRRPFTGSFEEELELIPPFEMPRTIIPGYDASEIPEAFRGSQTTPGWQPRR